jgi:hypothetical protein
MLAQDRCYVFAVSGRGRSNKSGITRHSRVLAPQARVWQMILIVILSQSKQLIFRGTHSHPPETEYGENEQLRQNVLC